MSNPFSFMKQERLIGVALEDVREAGRKGRRAFDLLDEFTSPVSLESGSEGCFPRGTDVRTVSGPRRIETIEVGDQVLAVNTSTRKWEVQEVRACRPVE